MYFKYNMWSKLMQIEFIHINHKLLSSHKSMFKYYWFRLNSFCRKNTNNLFYLNIRTWLFINGFFHDDMRTYTRVLGSSLYSMRIINIFTLNQCSQQFYYDTELLSAIHQPNFLFLCVVRCSLMQCLYYDDILAIEIIQSEE